MIKRITSVSILALTFSVTANASLIGDTVRVGHHYPNIANEYVGADITIGSGENDTFLAGYPRQAPFYEASFTGNSILVDYLRPEAWDDTSFNGLVVSDIDSVLTNVDVATNFVGWEDNNLAISDGALSFNWAGLPFNEGTFFNVTFDTQSASVSEPASLALLGLGLVGFGLFRRKKAAQ